MSRRTEVSVNTYLTVDSCITSSTHLVRDMPVLLTILVWESPMVCPSSIGVPLIPPPLSLERLTPKPVFLFSSLLTQTPPVSSEDLSILFVVFVLTVFLHTHFID